MASEPWPGQSPSCSPMGWAAPWATREPEGCSLLSPALSSGGQGAEVLGSKPSFQLKSALPVPEQARELPGRSPVPWDLSAGTASSDCAMLLSGGGQMGVYDGEGGDRGGGWGPPQGAAPGGYSALRGVQSGAPMLARLEPWLSGV